jgi:hypothetical protein
MVPYGFHFSAIKQRLSSLIGKEVTFAIHNEQAPLFIVSIVLIQFMGLSPMDKVTGMEKYIPVDC